MAHSVGFQDRIDEFEASEQATVDARRQSERDRDYYLGVQWTKKQIDVLKERKQPIVTINRIRRKVDFIRGAEIQARTKPKGLPRNPDDEDSANAATDAIRFVTDNNEYDTLRSEAREDIQVEGIGGIEVSVRAKQDEFEIVLSRIPWDRFFYDPHSSKRDFSDAKYMGTVLWMDLSRAKDLFKDKEEVLEATMLSPTGQDTYDDKPKINVWADRKRQRVRVISTNYLEKSVWTTAITTKGGYLVDPQPIPFLDEDGEPENNLIAQSVYVDRENARHGLVRDMISPQDEINHRRSKALHLLSVRQFKIVRGSGLDINEVKKELTKPDGAIEVNRSDDFEVLATNDLTAGQFALLQEAKDEIDNMGPNASLQGKDDQGLSGRALLAQQQGGMIELAPFLDAGRHLDLRVYRQIWNRIRQYWDQEKWIRVTDDENNIKFVGLNHPITAGEKFEESLKERGFSSEAIQQEMQAAEQDPRFNQVVEIQNHTAEMVIDIIVDETPNFATLQQEQFDMLIKLSAKVPIPPEVIIEASNLRSKDKIIKGLRNQSDDEEANRAAAEKAQVVEQLQLAGAKAEIEKTESEADKNKAAAFKLVKEAQVVTPAN